MDPTVTLGQWFDRARCRDGSQPEAWAGSVECLLGWWVDLFEGGLGVVGLGLAGGVGVPLGLVGVFGGLGPGGFVLFDGGELVGDVGVVAVGDVVPCGVLGEVGGVVDVV